MIIARRNFLTGMLAAIAAPAIVRFDSIMPVRSLILPEPMVRGVRWQSWPYGTPMPMELAEGSVGPESGRGVLKPLSYWLERLDKHRAVYPDLVWKTMPERIQRY